MRRKKMYCTYCGKELIEGKKFRYDMNTGKKIFERVCPEYEDFNRLYSEERERRKEKLRESERWYKTPMITPTFAIVNQHTKLF